MRAGRSIRELLCRSNPHVRRHWNQIQGTGVRAVGLEPTRSLEHGHLKPACLPVTSRPQRGDRTALFVDDLSVTPHADARSASGLFTAALDALDILWTRPDWHTIAIYRKAATARMDEFVGPKDRAVPLNDVHYTA
jgi:hypothetical protein